MKHGLKQRLLSDFFPSQNENVHGNHLISPNVHLPPTPMHPNKGLDPLPTPPPPRVVENPPRLTRRFPTLSSDDGYDFLTPQDQPVFTENRPPSPVPLKKKSRMEHSNHSNSSYIQQQMLSMTQEMITLKVKEKDGKNNHENMENNRDEHDMDQDETTSSSSCNEYGNRGNQNNMHTQNNMHNQDGYGNTNSHRNIVTTNSSPWTAEVHINPFLSSTSPHHHTLHHREKRKRSTLTFPPTSSRFLSDFIQVSTIGQGTFATVFHCIQRIDGMDYAIKKTKKALHGQSEFVVAIREVDALVALVESEFVVRYHTCWLEDMHVYIQMEYCPHTLQTRLQSSTNTPIPENELYRILQNITQALCDLHVYGMVHLDIKPSNIVYSRSQKYKLADFGNAVKNDGSMDPTEGDTRYLALERMHGSLAHLSAGDVFALGLTLFQVMSKMELPIQGPLWHSLRSGDVPVLPNYSRAFQQLIVMMMHPDPLQRPLPTDILQHDLLVTM